MTQTRESERENSGDPNPAKAEVLFPGRRFISADNVIASRAHIYSFRFTPIKKTGLALATTGAVVLSACETQTTTTRTTSTATDNGHVKIVNGKRYVYVQPELGSNLPARWLPEDSAAAQQSSSVETGTAESMRAIKDHTGEGAPPGGH